MREPNTKAELGATKSWREWAADASVDYWDCDDTRENLIHDELEEAVTYDVEGDLDEDGDVEAQVRATYPNGLTVYGWTRSKVTPAWLHAEAEHLAERFTEDFDDEFAGDDPLISNEMEAELASAIAKTLDDMRPRLVSWRCEQLVEVVIPLDELLSALREWPGTE